MKLQRKDWIDALRAVAILLVVVGHKIQDVTSFFVVTSPIKMPLFFAISGYLFSMKDSKTFLKKVIITLIVPWLLLGIIPQLIRLPYDGITESIAFLGKMLSGEVYWFMPCFILGSVIFHYVMKILRMNVWGVGVLSCFLFAFGIVLSKNNILDYAMANRAMTVQLYFWLGYLFRQHEGRLNGSKYKKLIITILFFSYALFISLGFILYPGENIDVHINSYYDYPLCIAQIVTGMLLLALVSQLFTSIPNWITEIGKCSLVIYMWHGEVILLSIAFITFFVKTAPYHLITISGCIIGVYGCILLNQLIRRYFPFITGNR